MGVIKSMNEHVATALSKLEQRKKEAELRRAERELSIAREREARILTEQRQREEERRLLVGMSQQELLAEIVLALRDVSKVFNEMKDQQKSLESEIEELESRISELEYSLD